MPPCFSTKTARPHTDKAAGSLEAVRLYEDRKTGKYCLLCNALQKFTLGNWIAEKLQELSPYITFFAEKENCMRQASPSPDTLSYPSKVPDKALLFTYAVFDDSGEDALSDIQFSETTYELTCGYKKVIK